MEDVIIVRAPSERTQDVVDSSISVEEAEIDALLTEAEMRLREKAVASSKGLRNRNTTLSKLDPHISTQPYIKTSTDGTVTITEHARKASDSAGKREKRTTLPLLRVDDPVEVKKALKEKRDKTAGPNWYNLPKPAILTSEAKRDLQMIKLRGVLDPHKHFKGSDSKPGELPKYFQMGTIVEGPTEFYSARINRKDRKKSIVEDLLASRESKSRFKKKYDEIQAKKRSGKKEWYKKLREKRKGGRK